MSEQLTIPTTETAPETPPVVASETPPEATPVEPAAAVSAPTEAPPAVELKNADQEAELKKPAKRKPADKRAAEVEALQARIDELENKSETNTKQMQKHDEAMRSALLDKLGIRAKFRAFAPKIDPFTETGRADLEAWAAENPELRDVRPVPAPEFDFSSQVKSFNSPHLVNTENWKDSIRTARKGGER